MHFDASRLKRRYGEIYDRNKDYIGKKEILVHTLNLFHASKKKNYYT